MPTHLVWFRRDLRLQDNLALAAACRDASARVLALYISTPAQWRDHDMAPRQAAFISVQLNGLQVALAGKGIPLLFYEVADFNASIETVKNVCRQHDVSHLFITISMRLTSVSVMRRWKKRCNLSSAKALTIA